jgi:hypothetical protein
MLAGKGGEAAKAYLTTTVLSECWLGREERLLGLPDHHSLIRVLARKGGEAARFPV